MPDSPNDAEDQAGPDWSKPALQQWQGEPTPAKLFDGAEEQGQPQRWQHLIPGGEGKRAR